MKKRKIILGLIFLLVGVGMVLASSPSIPLPENKNVCINSEGKWLSAMHKSPNNLFLALTGSSLSYSIATIYCQCGDYFIDITNMENWQGCKSTSSFMSEVEFIDRLESSAPYIESVAGNIDKRYIEIIEKEIKLNKFKDIIKLLFGVAIIIFLFYLYKNRLKNKKG